MFSSLKQLLQIQSMLIVILCNKKKTNKPPPQKKLITEVQKMDLSKTIYYIFTIYSYIY